MTEVFVCASCIRTANITSPLTHYQFGCDPVKFASCDGQPVTFLPPLQMAIIAMHSMMAKNSINLVLTFAALKRIVCPTICQTPKLTTKHMHALGHDPIPYQGRTGRGHDTACCHAMYLPPCIKSFMQKNPVLHQEQNTPHPPPSPRPSPRPSK